MVSSMIIAYFFSTVLTLAWHISHKIWKALILWEDSFYSSGIPLLCTFATQNMKLYSKIEYCIPWCKVLYALVGIKYPDIMLPCWIWNSFFLRYLQFLKAFSNFCYQSGKNFLLTRKCRMNPNIVLFISCWFWTWMRKSLCL